MLLARCSQGALLAGSQPIKLPVEVQLAAACSSRVKIHTDLRETDLYVPGVEKRLSGRGCGGDRSRVCP